MADDQMKQFVDLSAILTGIGTSELAPPLATPEEDVKTVYFNTAKKRVPATLNALLTAYASNESKPPAQIADILLNQSGDDIRYLCRSIMLMWYLGSWYDPGALKTAAGTTNFVPSSVVSANAYAEGWVWKVAQTHPMGASNSNFGDWSNNPPALSIGADETNQGTAQ